MMKKYILILICFVLSVQSVDASQTEKNTRDVKNCRKHGEKVECDTGSTWSKNEDSLCNPEKRGRCGKRRGDWYGASQPVVTAEEARMLLLNYFKGQGYTVSDVVEKKWGFKADILDKDGKVIDRVLIDKRSGRIRSLY